MVNKAKEMIDLALNPPIPEIGTVYVGTVVGTTKFGAFVNILPGRDGLVHISKMGNGQRVNNVEDVMNVGDIFDVRVDDMDDRGKVSLTPVGDGFENNDSDDSQTERAKRSEGSDSKSDSPQRETRSRTRTNSSKSDDSSEPKSRAKASNDEDRDFASFSDFLDTEMKEKYGDLGPEEPRRPRNDNKRRNNNRR